MVQNWRATARQQHPGVYPKRVQRSRKQGWSIGAAGRDGTYLSGGAGEPRAGCTSPPGAAHAPRSPLGSWPSGCSKSHEAVPRARVCSGEEHDEHRGGRRGASGCLSELEEQRLLVEARPRCSSCRLRAELPEPRSAAVSLALLILSPLCCLFARNPCPPTPLPANRWLGRVLSPKLGAGVAKSHGCRTTTGKQGRAGGPDLPLAFGPRPFERHR